MLPTTNIHIGNLDLLDLENKLDKVSEQLPDNQFLTLDVGNTIEDTFKGYQVGFFIKICLIDEFEVDYVFEEFDIKDILNATRVDCVTIVNELMYMTRNMIIESYKTNVNEIFDELVKEMI